MNYSSLYFMGDGVVAIGTQNIETVLSCVSLAAVTKQISLLRHE